MACFISAISFGKRPLLKSLRERSIPRTNGRTPVDVEAIEVINIVPANKGKWQMRFRSRTVENANNLCCYEEIEIIIS